jgi:arginase
VTATFVVVPQWQGSGSSRAMRLVDGAQAIAGDLPGASTIIVDVPLEAGEGQGSGVARFTSLQLVRDRQAQVLAGVSDWALTIGGDCGVELAAVSHVADSREVALVWFDAHPDLHTPESAAVGAFHSMVLRTLIGEGAAPLVPARPLSPERVVLVGTRSFDDAEDAYVTNAGMRVLDGEDVDPAELVAAIEATGATSVYLHVDLDVLDPGEIDGIGYPEPFGLTAGKLIELIRAVKAKFALAGAGITEFAPASAERAADDLPTILRIIGALTS